MENVAVLTEDGTFALFFRPHPWGFDRSRVPIPGNLPSRAKKKKHANAGGQRGAWDGGTLAMGEAGIDWCINILQLKFATQKYSTKELHLFN